MSAESDFATPPARTGWKPAEPVDLSVAVGEVVGAVVVVILASGAIHPLREPVRDLCSAVMAAALGGAAVQFARRRGSGSLLAVGSAALALILVTAIIVPADQLRLVNRIVGVAIMVIGGGLVISNRRAGKKTIAEPATLGILGLALVAVPDGAPSFAVLVVATVSVGWLLLDAAMRSGLLDLGDTDPDAGFLELLGKWTRHNGSINTDRKSAVDSLFFDGPNARSELMRYSMLMFFASGIAAMGVLTDSTAVVIGAMLIAPLFTPILGMGMALTMGWPGRLTRTGLTVLLGMGIAIGMAALLSASIDLPIDVTTNTQIVSRSSPTIADLVVAILAGAAGGYAHTRKAASSSMPGVAIAIALVPPLSVVGVTAEHGRWQMSAGTLLLFLTNLLAIMLVGGLVFLLTGFAPWKRVAENQKRVRTALGAVVVLAILVVGGLVVNGREVTSDAATTDRVRRAVGAWLGDNSDFSIVSVSTESGTVTLVLAGPGDPPSLDELSKQVSDRIDDQVVLDVQWIARDRKVVTVDP